MVKQKVSFKQFFQSIYFKLPALLGILFLISFQTIGIVFRQQLDNQLVMSFQERMIAQSELVAKSAIQSLEEPDSYQRKSDLQNLMYTAVGQNVSEVQIIGANHEVISASREVSLSLLDKQTLDQIVQQRKMVVSQYVPTNEKDRLLRIVQPLILQDKVVGVLVMDSAIEHVYAQMQDIVSLLNQIMFAALGLIIVAGIIISNRQIARPVSAIKEKTEQIALGEYDASDVTIKGQGELSDLAKSINDLSIRIKEANASTESERQRLDSVLTHMSDGVIATDRRSNVVIVNEAALHLLDVNREDIQGVSIMDVFKIRQKYTYRELLETTDDLILSVVSEGVETVIRVEFSIIKRDSGFISGIVCVLSDITEQEKIDRERREFVSNVSHELRTPLTSMRSYTEALIDGAWKDEEVAPNFLEVIQSETDRMIRMVTDLLNLSKMDSGRQALQMDTLNLTRLIGSILDRYDMLLQSEMYMDKQYALVRELPSESLFAEVDHDRFIQVIDNILNNAIKYSPDGGKITCRLVETSDNIVISITDEGLGIPKKSLPHVFKRFYRVDKARSREQGGTGLGLAISKEVIELHGGRIWVNSRENKGSTFFVSLPKVVFEEDDDWY